MADVACATASNSRGLEHLRQSLPQLTGRANRPEPAELRRRAHLSSPSTISGQQAEPALTFLELLPYRRGGSHHTLQRAAARRPTEARRERWPPADAASDR